MRRRILISLLTPVLVVAGAATASASASASASAPRSDTVKGDRATVRDAPGRLVLANARGGDRVDVQSRCGGWVRVRVRTTHAMATPTGWTLRSGLTRASRKGGVDGLPDGCAQARRDDERWRSYVGAINSPFRSYRYTGTGTPSRSETAALWRRVFFSNAVALSPSPECTPSYNYIRDAAGERVDPTQRIAGLEPGEVGYRYVTRTGAVALVSARRPGQRAGVWSFVPAACLAPKAPGGTLYFPVVVQLERSAGVRALRSRDLARYGCSAGTPSPSHPAYGWWPDPQTRRPCPV